MAIRSIERRKNKIFFFVASLDRLTYFCVLKEKRKMNRKELVDAVVPDCPIRNILARMSDKWSLLVLYTLSEGEVMRFNTLRKHIPDISQKMLTVTLRTLEEDGFIRRKVYAEIPPKVEYSLTERAFSLLPCVNNLIAWAKENMEAILKDRTRNKAKLSIPEA